jgi:hypothetical protein
MTAQTLLEKPKLVPFTLSLVEKIDRRMYKEAISEADAIKQSYDPTTQLSTLSIYAGTSLTYTTTGSNWLNPRDDSEESDT